MNKKGAYNFGGSCGVFEFLLILKAFYLGVLS